MKISLKIIGCMALIAVLALAGCGPPNVGSDRDLTRGSITFRFNDEYAKSINPPISPDIDHYLVSGSGPSGESFGPVVMGSGEQVEDLLPGAWTVTVVGRNAGGIALGEGSSPVTVLVGQIATCNVTVVEYTGDGSFLLDIAWEPDIVTDPEWTGSLKDSAANVTQLVFTNMDEVACTVDSLTDPLHEGWFTMVTQLWDAPNGLDGSEILTTGRAEAVRILSGYQTLGALWFHAVQEFGVIEVIIDTDFHDEIALTGTPAFSDMSTLGPPPNDETTWVTVYDDPVDFTASAGETVTSVFYWQGEQVLVGDTYTLDPSAMLEDYFVLDLVCFSTDGRRAGSDSWIIRKSDLDPNQIHVQWTGGYTDYRLVIADMSGSPVNVYDQTFSDGVIGANEKYVPLPPNPYRLLIYEGPTASENFEYYLDTADSGSATLVTVDGVTVPIADFGTIDFTP